MVRATIGPYEIRGELGRGAMAVVWRAFDPSVGREVAIKEPKLDDSLDPALREELVARFIREGKTAGGLNHHGIVTIYGADVFDGRPAIIMELIEGSTLAELLRRGPLTVEVAVNIADQLLEAVGFAHAKGVVHRDIKPENVFITSDGRVKLTDFGIAHVGAGTALTQAGTVMGTPGYMAPEQIRGEDVDARADLFAISVILHEMLTGANSFLDDAHPTTVMYRVLNEALPDVRSLAPNVPDWIAATIAVASAKSSSERFTSAHAMRQALQGEVAVAMPTSQTGGRPRARTTMIAAVLTLGLTVAALLGWAMWPSGATPGQGASGTASPVSTMGASDTKPMDDVIAMFHGEKIYIIDPLASPIEPREVQWAGDVPKGLEPVYSARDDALYFLKDEVHEVPFTLWRLVRGKVAQEFLTEEAFGNLGFGLGLFEGKEDEPMILYQGDVWAIGPDGEDRARVAQLPAECSRPQYSSTGRYAYTIMGDGLYLASDDGAPGKRIEDPNVGMPLRHAFDLEGQYCWTPDGKRLIVASSGYDFLDTEMRDANSLIALDVNGVQTRTLFELETPGAVSSPKSSPDGSLIAFCVDDALWVVNADGTGARELADGTNPVWVPRKWAE